ncbi:hypothetical protein CADE109221_15885 [Castellaniella denitrificans]
MQPSSATSPCSADTGRLWVVNSSPSTSRMRPWMSVAGQLRCGLSLWNTRRATWGCASAMRSTASRQWAYSVCSLRRNLRRAGMWSNSWRTSTRVPTAPAAGVGSACPAASCHACASPAVREVRVNWATEAMEASASPRNPRVATDSSSARDAILLVAWRCRARGIWSGGMPWPSSATRMRRMPPPSRRISMARAPASRAFSSNSFSTEAGRSMTSPAAIWLIRTSGRAAMVRIMKTIIVSKSSGARVAPD